LPYAFLGYVTPSPREIVSNAKSVEDKKTRFMHQRKSLHWKKEKKITSKSKKKKKNQLLVPLLDGTRKKT